MWRWGAERASVLSWAEAWTVHLGPWWWHTKWQTFAPGAEHVWSWVIPPEWRWDQGTLSATAHSWDSGRVAVTLIESQRNPDYSLHTHIRIRNTGFQSIRFYALYVSVVRPASLKPS